MKKVLLFGGTTEGRLIAEKLSEHGYTVFISVATQYGESLLPESDTATILTGRLDAADMAALMEKYIFDVIIDATHPYATDVTKNISHCADVKGIACIRVVREEQEAQNCDIAENIEDAIEKINKTEGNVLIATGSKELLKYQAVINFQERLYVRVLPTMEALKICEHIKIPQNHIIAMQGPFSKELNRAMMQQYNIKTLVTKSSGDIGGFSEKQSAATQAEVQMIVIKRPTTETGYKLAEIINLIETKTI